MSFICILIGCFFLGCKVVGFAGTEEKVNWLKDDLKFNFAFNYKQVHLDKILKKFCLEGVDCYFDNVKKIHLLTKSKIHSLSISHQ